MNEQDWTKLDKNGQDSKKLDMYGQDWTGVDETRLECTRINRIEQS